MKVHIVTLLFKIQRAEIDGRKDSFYLKLFQQLLESVEENFQNFTVSVFTNYSDSELKKLGSKKYLHIHTKSKIPCNYEIEVNELDWGYHSKKEIHVKSSSYLNLINSKIYFINEVTNNLEIENDDRVLFLDAGISRFGNNLSNILKFDVKNKILLSFINTEQNRIRLKFLKYSNISQIKLNKIFYRFDFNLIAGGIMFCDPKIISGFQKKYYETLELFVSNQILPTEQVVLSYIYFVEKLNIIKLYFPQSESKGLNFLEIINDKNIKKYL